MSWSYRLMALLALCAAVSPAAALDESDLLPVDQAFVAEAQAVSRDRIELRWKIADGYYLYRQRTAVSAEAGFRAGALQLPEGQHKHDEYFGDVETYRGSLRAVLPGTAEPGAGVATLKLRYQGCADAGVCFPPQTRTLQVRLPGAGNAAVAAALPAAAPAGGGSPLAALLGQGAGAVDPTPLPPERAFGFEAIAQDGNTLLLRFTPAPGYYLYRDHTTVKLEGARGIETGRPRWPQGQSLHDEHFGQVAVYFGQTEVPVPLLRNTAAAAKASLVATFQGCQRDGICYPPMTRKVRLSLPAGLVTPKSTVLPGLPPAQPGSAEAAPETTSRTATATATESLAPIATAAAADARADNAARSLPPPTKPTGLAAILLLALLGGLILNLMPCVLPVLSLKVIGLARSGESHAHARRHAVWYTLGVLASFAGIGALVLALRAAGQAAGWGFQLQHPWFVAALAYLMFAVGLGLSGLYTPGIAVGTHGQKLMMRGGRAGDFLTGVLACVVASPCIAPFMGPALAYAFAAPAAMALLVFLALGLGLALPFLLIGFVPALARRLPRPGAWMETFKQVLAYPMFLTAVWLLWVLGKQRGIDAAALVLAGAVVLALGLWWYERSRWRDLKIGRALAALLVLAALVPVWAVGRLPPPARAAAAGEDVVPFSAERLRQLRGDGQVVFVNITADWCVTCKANERGVFATDAFRGALAARHATYMVGDWTDVDPKISAFLAEHKAVGVPLYVVYGPGAAPQVLPTVLTEAMVDDALAKAGR
mgnify:CR=1 FL=1